MATRRFTDVVVFKIKLKTLIEDLVHAYIDEETAIFDTNVDRCLKKDLPSFTIIKLCYQM